jgi:hypothetical protein
MYLRHNLNSQIVLYSLKPWLGTVTNCNSGANVILLAQVLVR